MNDMNDILNLLNLNSVYIAIHEVSARWMKRWRRLLRLRAPGLESTDWTDSMTPATWIEFESSRPKVNPEKEKRIMLKQQRQQRVKVQLWEPWNRKDLSKISSIHFSQRCDHLSPFFCSNESSVCDSGCTVAALENFQEL